MIVYLIRHGETDWNKSKKLQGRSDIPLNEFGRHLAEETRPAFDQVDFAAVYTSPLKRAKETAQLVIGDRDIPIIEDQRLIEMGFGDYEGLKCKGEDIEIPDEEFLSFFNAPEEYDPPEKGESFEEVSARLKDFLTELFTNEELQDKTVLVSTHGAALCGILRVIKGLPISEYWGKGVHKNCGVTILEYKDKKVTIKDENITFYKDHVPDW